jgi:putative Mg2+ transporter-C (MgtC) family protein
MYSIYQYVGSLFYLPEHNYLDVLVRLTFAVIIGGLIGMERSGRNHDAGLRTHILVCLGATTIMILSETTHMQYGGDIGRFGAQVVSGIGFLGAGCIMVKGQHVSGLTTAAGLWATACIGLTIGMGYLFISSVTAALLLISTKILRPVSSKIKEKGALNHYTIRVKMRSRSNFSVISDYLVARELQIESVEMQSYNIFIVKIAAPVDFSSNRLTLALMEMDDITEVKLMPHAQ